MGRSLSWYPLASADPVPGDPAAVGADGEDYQAVARSILNASTRLREIADIDATVSRAVDEVRAQATEVAEKIDQAHGRYHEVGAALISYKASLELAQRESEAALLDAQAAQRSVDTASSLVGSATRALADTDDEGERTMYQRQLNRARAERHDAEAALGAARARLDDAVAFRDGAARRAIDAIEAAVGSDDLNDGWWENFGSHVAHFVSDVAGLVATVAGVLALVLCWVPVLGQALALVALVAGAVALVADIFLAAHGEGSWADVAWGAVAVLSFGAGRVLASSARAVATSTRAVASLEANATAMANGLRGTARAIQVEQTVGSRIASIARYQAVDDLTAAQGIRPWLEGLKGLSPQQIFQDIRQGVTYASDDFLRANVLDEGLTALRAARAEGGIRPLFAALQGESGLAGLYGELRGVNAATLPLTQAALLRDMAAGATWMTAASADAFHSVVGFDVVGEWLSGGDAPIAAAGMFTWLHPGPSAAATLNLN